MSNVRAAGVGPGEVGMMSQAEDAHGVAPEVVDPDDWDHHWDAFGEALAGSPANVFRIRLVLDLLGRPPAGSTVLDIGSGQGEFAIQLAELYPDLSVWGVEYSQQGVDLSRAAAKAKGINASFTQRDLLRPVALDPDQPAANFAVCSEVLEHVDDPALLLRNARSLLAPGCRLVITVPGGPRSAFDHSIGHVRHFTADALRGVITDGGFAVDQVRRAGFPFFNLYKLALVARGRRLITDVANLAPDRKPSLAEAAATRFFDTAFRYTAADFPLGWQMAAVAYVPESGA
jgi:SAM-dependent methyltransferase